MTINQFITKSILDLFYNKNVKFLSNYIVGKGFNRKIFLTKYVTSVELEDDNNIGLYFDDGTYLYLSNRNVTFDIIDKNTILVTDYNSNVYNI